MILSSRLFEKHVPVSSMLPCRVKHRTGWLDTFFRSPFCQVNICEHTKPDHHGLKKPLAHLAIGELIDGCAAGHDPPRCLERRRWSPSGSLNPIVATYQESMQYWGKKK